MKQMKKQDMINRMLRIALWYQIHWCEETAYDMKNYYRDQTDGIFVIIRELDLVDKFWELRNNPDVIDDIHAYGYSGWDGSFRFEWECAK